MYINSSIIEEIWQFRDYIIGELNYSQNTVESYLLDLLQFANYLHDLKIFDVHALKVNNINNFLEYLIFKKKLKDVTVARKSSSIIHFAKFLRRENILPDFTEEKIYKVKKQKPTLPNIYSYKKIRQIVNFYLQKNNLDDSRKAMIVALIFTTGVRVSELINIRIKDFLFDEESKINFLRIMGKGSKERIVPVHDFAMQIVQDFLDVLNDKKAIWLLSNNQQHLTRQRVAQILWEIEGELGYKIHPHLLRHSFATHFLEKSKNIRMVQKVLGHEDLSSTQRYTHVEKSKLKKKVLTLHPLNNMHK